jgi:hypothetical protein
MKLFGKKRAGPQEMVRAPRKAADDAAANATVTHRLTLDLSRAMDLAAMLASSRATQFIEITDVLAGLYMYEWDRLASYWPEENRDEIEDILRDICQISPQRWNYWITLYDSRLKEGEPQPRWKQLRKPKPLNGRVSSPVPSASLRAVFDAAEVVSPFRDPRGEASQDLQEGGALPVLTSECVLLCMVKFVASNTGRKLAQSGLNILQLERAVLDPKRSPLR